MKVSLYVHAVSRPADDFREVVVICLVRCAAFVAYWEALKTTYMLYGGENLTSWEIQHHREQCARGKHASNSLAV